MPHAKTTRPLSYYVQTPAVDKLCNAFGDRLNSFSQEEKYQLCTAIAIYLWGQCEPASDDFDEDFDVDFSALISDESDLLATQNSQLRPEISAHTMSALVILQDSSPEILAQLLPAIAEYARDDDR